MTQPTVSKHWRRVVSYPDSSQSHQAHLTMLKRCKRSDKYQANSISHDIFSVYSVLFTRINIARSSSSKARLFCHRADRIRRRGQTIATVSSSLRPEHSDGTWAGTCWRLWSDVQQSPPRESRLPDRWHPSDLQRVQDISDTTDGRLVA